MCEELYDPFQDQVECARYRAERDALAQMVQVICERMEVHFLGIEGMDESPVASWARDLRAALGSLHAPVRDATTSACDLLPDEDREAAAWVRGHGGLEHVRAEWRSLNKLKRQLEKEQAKVKRQQRHIESVQGKCRERQGRICELSKKVEEMRPRLMPEGMKWPRYEDGEPVLAGNVLLDANGEAFSAVSFLFTCDWWSVKGYRGTDFCTISKDTRRELSGMPYSRCVRRPVPKVYDADGVEICEGDRVWSTQLDEPHEWIVIDPHEDRDDSQTVLVSIGDRTGHARPEDLMHRAPVLAADGEPLEVGQTVWHVSNGIEFTVVGLPKSGEYHAVKLRLDDGAFTGLDPDQLTHQRPVLDADGVPIKVGDTVYNKVTGEPGTVIVVDNDGQQFATVKSHDGGNWCDPLCFTHTKPDSWERIEEDLSKSYTEYWGCVDVICNRCPAEIDGKKPHERFDACPHNCISAMRHDIVRRCKALAERAWSHGDE